jgi:hypothetical protein
MLLQSVSNIQTHLIIPKRPSLGINGIMTPSEHELRESSVDAGKG